MSSLKKYSLKKVIYYKFIVTNYENFNFLKIPYENKFFFILKFNIELTGNVW